MKINVDKKLKAYIAYLKSEASSNAQYRLDPIQIRVLNEILFSLSDNKAIKVGDILLLSEIASQATLHAALKKLVANKMIVYRTVSNSRAKYLEITDLGHKRFLELLKAFSGK